MASVNPLQPYTGTELGEALRDKLNYNLRRGGSVEFEILTADDTIGDMPADNRGLFLLDASSAAVDVDLPTLADNQGRRLTFKAMDVTNACTFTPEGAETVDGSTGAVSLTVQYETVTVIGTTNTWVIE